MYFLKMKIEIFRKTANQKPEEKYVGNAYQTIFLSTFWYHKHELEIARFGARAPCAGAVDVKRLICFLEYLEYLFSVVAQSQFIRSKY